MSYSRQNQQEEAIAKWLLRQLFLAVSSISVSLSLGLALIIAIPKQAKAIPVQTTAEAPTPTEASSAEDTDGNYEALLERLGLEQLRRDSHTVNCLTCYPPAHPEDAAAGIEGDVWVTIDFDESGNVTKVWLDRSSGNMDIDMAVLQAVRQYSFEPNGQAGSTTMQVDFGIEEDQQPASSEPESHEPGADE
ncbi:energy transducer TonB [cf. Phormidesmis sp. LEGE 11477]|uniref:energy transducer TonB n=1 Tax=cf. Phormidesmis sp. LEGE 11477 TaxID=1828680 RepID=UPI00188109C3|nr:energy transducer TonB [cf. Phormidesmis sp. LEGE 11477]MBE9064132.1 TonB family protein [cf. Phormidesmis sp. LEGE 11477]